MITDPDAVRVLCFGDSNTYGTCLRESETDGAPTGDPDYVRLHADRRWTGVLQRLLGDGYDVIEEGLKGARPMWTTRSVRGATGGPLRALSSEPLPLDVVVVMLGGNDLKPSFERTPTGIANALHGYVDDVAAT